MNQIEKILAWVCGLGATACGAASAATGLLPANVGATLAGVGLVLVAVERYVTDGTQPTVMIPKSPVVNTPVTPPSTSVTTSPGVTPPK